MATEGKQVVRLDGSLSNPTHSLAKHGPEVTDQLSRPKCPKPGSEWTFPQSPLCPIYALRITRHQHQHHCHRSGLLVANSVVVDGNIKSSVLYESPRVRPARWQVKP